MCENFCLENSNLTLALKKDSIFISSFPGFLIFVTIVKNHYKKNKFFQFSHFDLPKLYSSILNFIHFFADNRENLQKTNILTKQIEDSHIDYFICGQIYADEKVVIFRLEANLDAFELCFKVNELNDFLNTLHSIIISCLCLQPLQNNMIKNAILQPLEIIVNFGKSENAKNFLLMYYKDTLCASIIDNLSTTLVHYNYVVIILHKLKSLVNQDLLDDALKALIDLN